MNDLNMHVNWYISISGSLYSPPQLIGRNTRKSGDLSFNYPIGHITNESSLNNILTNKIIKTDSMWPIG